MRHYRYRYALPKHAVQFFVLLVESDHAISDARRIANETRVASVDQRHVPAPSRQSSAIPSRSWRDGTEFVDEPQALEQFPARGMKQTTERDRAERFLERSK